MLSAGNDAQLVVFEALPHAFWYHFQLPETKEALERQSASSQVLQVISSFAGELDPVFQAVLGNSTRICEAKFGILMLRKGEERLLHMP